ncbi:STK_08120 family protein [Bacteriovorax sp. Seq25_V]|uniref:STK_08120 family protein n=1 Tax=Bacteriovorax sp. Seq25_V TaxID=1201288 RepID=UPI00038A1516|nr:STK_08120 family protein [Bacteriovorax sp. Seq25_V]EQC43275.1 putative lipoprotein [Bacteriovorax sp. Seq25_V]
MKIYLLAILLIIASCDKPSSQDSTSVPSTQQEEQVLKVSDNFSCDSNDCIDSIVAIVDGNNLCTGVINDGKVLVTNDCGKLLDCGNVDILDINNGVNKCSSISVGEELTTIEVQTDISSLNLNPAILDKNDTAVNAISISKNSEGKYVQDKLDCAITYESIYALGSTKTNSKNLAIKDCPNLKLGSVIAKNAEVISLVTTSDTLNLSKSLICGDDCDGGEVDKLNFLLKEIYNKTRYKNVLNNDLIDYQGFFGKTIKSLRDNNILLETKVQCVITLLNNEITPIILENKFNEFGEFLKSKYKLLDTIIVSFVPVEYPFYMPRKLSDRDVNVTLDVNENKIEYTVKYCKQMDDIFKK